MLEFRLVARRPLIAVLRGQDVASSRAVDRDFESRADGAHLSVGQTAKPIDQHGDRDTFD
jgi:hypothetical protein